jgi:hypothetical protein
VPPNVVTTKHHTLTHLKFGEPALQISVKLDVDKALKIMSRFHKKKMPFAVALGLTMTAKKVAKVGQRMMVWELDRPTPFTIKGGRALINQILKRDGCSHGFT